MIRHGSEWRRKVQRGGKRRAEMRFIRPPLTNLPASSASCASGTTPGVIRKDSARSIKTRPSKQHPLNLVVARPQLDLVEVALFGEDGSSVVPSCMNVAWLGL
jgi:hypothetical protein